MKKYFDNLNLAQMNKTFYQYPRGRTIETWRKKIPENFELARAANLPSKTYKNA
jgi:uncharacterized protein YecE (DUF72 family)